MIKQHIIGLVASAGVLASTSIALAAYPGQQLAGQAHVSLARARTLAAHAANGTIAKQELEKEHGGSGLRYTFEVKTVTGMREVGIDAKSGALLENSLDESGESADDGK